VNLAGLNPANKFSHELLNTPYYNGSAHDSAVASNGTLYWCTGNQGSSTAAAPDMFTVGDFSGPYDKSYKPSIGWIAKDGLTFGGPANQPSCGGRSFFSDMDLTESAGKVYACGYGFNGIGGIMDFFDPDGPGPIAQINLNTGTTRTEKGFAMVYNTTTWAVLQTVIWESTYGGDYTTDITVTPDGGFVVVGQTYGSLGGKTNPAEGTLDGYLEKYNADGSLAWNYQTETTEGDTFGDVTVDPDGGVYVSGNSGSDAFLKKFTSAGALVWTTIIDNGGTSDSQRDHGNIDKYKIYYLSQYNPTGGGTPWVNTLSYVPQGNNENLLQKLIPGDFDDGTGTGTSDGFVNFADVQYVATTTKPGLTGVDTYDFNEDGDSTLADTYYLITDLMDYVVGDIHAGTHEPLSDVDNADIGKAIGSFTGTAGSGKVYLDGDKDFDGDVDDDDIAFVVGAFSGALAPAGGQTAGTPGATLIYTAEDGQVWISADEAAGGMITSFQLENNQGTFVPASYAGPAGGGFGGALEDVTANVIADTDLTLAGFSGLPSLGTIFPTGMDQAALEAYLTTAVYTGQPGSGQMQFKLVVAVLPVDYETWAASFPTLTDPDPSLDFELDGFETGIEYVLGGNPTLDDVASVAPTGANDGSGLVFTYRRTDLANSDPTTAIMVEYGSDLVAWTQAQQGGNGVAIVENDNFYGPGIDQVVVTLPDSLAVNGMLFARLKVTITPPVTLLNEDFETDDGGFTFVTTGGTPWAYGAPDSPDGGGGAVTAGNGGSAMCCGTNLVGGYTANTDASLRSPLIDLTGITAATLSFARVIDAPLNATPKHTLEVNVIDATTEVKTTVIAPFEDPDLNTTPWETMSVPIPAEALGKSVYLEWRFVGNGTDDYLGAYIDDVVVTAP
jgi:hypothetical protein